MASDLHLAPITHDFFQLWQIVPMLSHSLKQFSIVFTCPLFLPFMRNIGINSGLLSLKHFIRAFLRFYGISGLLNLNTLLLHLRFTCAFLRLKILQESHFSQFLPTSLTISLLIALCLLGQLGDNTRHQKVPCCMERLTDKRLSHFECFNI